MNTNSPFFKWCRRYVRLPFFLTVGAIVCLYFFNDNSALTYYESQLEISRLKEEIKDNADTLAYYKELTRSLDSDRAALEKIVRERHHMRRTNEDVYIYEN